MLIPKRRLVGWGLLAAALAFASSAVGPRVAWALEVGEKAPEFNLPATTGLNVALSDFRGKKFVLLEFYGLDFAPT